jgi:hypothetical protein
VESKNFRVLIIIELFVVASIAFFLFTGVVLLNYKGMIPLEFMERILTYLSLTDYIILYLVFV